MLSGSGHCRARHGDLRGTVTGEHLLGVELANLGNSGDRELDGTSRDGERLNRTSGGEGDSGVRMGVANSNGSAMSSSVDSSAGRLAIYSAGGRFPANGG